MRLPNANEFNAAARHVLSFAMGAITFAASVHLITSDQANMLTTSISQISHALGELALALGPIAAAISAYYAAKSASPAEQLKRVAANPAVAKVVVTDQTVADAVPSEKVTTNG